MLDYRGIEALYTVHRLQSFEAASKHLHITQSAVSQRIKGLETHFGEPLLVRTLPYKPTKLGEHLIGHYKRLCLLEESLTEQIKPTEAKPHIAIAINRDSLETWFLEAIEHTNIFGNIMLEVIADDQELTLDYLKKGVVSACLSTSGKAILGGNATFVGNMEYVLAASPEFVKQHFTKGDPKKSLLNSPAIKFDRNDQLHERYLEKFFGLRGDEIHFHIIPSVEGFKKYALLGHGYGMIPKIDILDELKQKKLVQLHKDKVWQIPFYWHSWDIESKFYRKFNTEMIALMKKLLAK